MQGGHQRLLERLQAHALEHRSGEAAPLGAAELGSEDLQRLAQDRADLHARIDRLAIRSCRRIVGVSLIGNAVTELIGAARSMIGSDENIEKTESCWIWKGNFIKGYGAMFYKKVVKAHRFSYEIYKGKIEKNIQIKREFSTNLKSTLISIKERLKVLEGLITKLRSQGRL